MAHVEKSIEVEKPVDQVYAQWTQFEDFPKFMENVEEVRQLDDKHLEWRAKVAGTERKMVRRDPLGPGRQELTTSVSLRERPPSGGRFFVWAGSMFGRLTCAFLLRCRRVAIAGANPIGKEIAFVSVRAHVHRQARP